MDGMYYEILCVFLVSKMFCWKCWQFAPLKLSTYQITRRHKAEGHNRRNTVVRGHLPHADLKGSFVAAAVTGPAGTATADLDGAVADAIHALRTGVGRLTLQIGNTWQTQSYSNPLANASYSCPHNCEMIKILWEVTDAQTEELYSLYKTSLRARRMLSR
jgi:hypothetical protein